MNAKMAENLAKRPAKGILKTSSSFEQQEAQRRLQDIKWDEMNILQTLHPPDKDYGHMKIEEPKTPYSYYRDELDTGSDKEMDALDAEVLAKKIALSSEQLPKVMMDEDDEDESETDEPETEEEREKKKAFEFKRKIHYNEFYAVKLARKLMQNDSDEEEEDIDTDETKDEVEEKKPVESKSSGETATTTSE